MKYNRDKVLTVMTANNAKVGQKGWFADNPKEMGEICYTQSPKTLKEINDWRWMRRFSTGEDSFAFFYPAQEPTYAERQAQWVKENNVKAGTKVRVTRTFAEDEDGSCCWGHDDLVGMTGVVGYYGIAHHSLGVDMSDGSFIAIPYFALEVIKKPTYRPINKDGLLACPFCGEFPKGISEGSEYKHDCKISIFYVEHSCKVIQTTEFAYSEQQSIDGWNWRS